MYTTWKPPVLAPAVIEAASPGWAVNPNKRGMISGVVYWSNPIAFLPFFKHIFVKRPSKEHQRFFFYLLGK